MNMERTLFVLDFDGTYDLEEPEGYGAPPLVYLIPVNMQNEVEECAKKASKTFNLDPLCDVCIGDLFDHYLKENCIEFQMVGQLQIPFRERESDYLADYIPRVVV